MKINLSSKAGMVLLAIGMVVATLVWFIGCQEANGETSKSTTLGQQPEMYCFTIEEFEALDEHMQEASMIHWRVRKRAELEEAIKNAKATSEEEENENEAP